MWCKLLTFELPHPAFLRVIITSVFYCLGRYRMFTEGLRLFMFLLLLLSPIHKEIERNQWGKPGFTLANLRRQSSQHMYVSVEVSTGQLINELRQAHVLVKWQLPVQYLTQLGCHGLLLMMWKCWLAILISAGTFKPTATWQYLCLLFAENPETILQAMKTASISCKSIWSIKTKEGVILVLIKPHQYVQ